MCAEGQELVVTGTTSVFLFNSFSFWDFSPWTVSFLSVPFLSLFTFYKPQILGKKSGRAETVGPRPGGAHVPSRALSHSYVKVGSLKASMTKPKWALHASGLLSDKHFKFGNLYPHRIYYPGKLDFQIWQQWKE